MKSERGYDRRGTELNSTEASFSLTRSVLKLLVGKPWRALLSGIGIAAAFVLTAEVFISVSVVLFAVFIAADVCSYFLDKNN